MDPSRQSYQLPREGSLAFKDRTSSPPPSAPSHPDHQRKHRRRHGPPDRQPVMPLTSAGVERCLAGFADGGLGEDGELGGDGQDLAAGVVVAPSEPHRHIMRPSADRPAPIPEPGRARQAGQLEHCDKADQGGDPFGQKAAVSRVGDVRLDPSYPPGPCRAGPPSRRRLWPAAPRSTRRPLSARSGQ